MELLATEVVAALGDALWRGALLTLVVAALLRALRSVSAATRYAIWYATLLAVVSLPFVRAPSRARPRQEVALPHEADRHRWRAARAEGPPVEAPPLASPARDSGPAPRVELALKPGAWAVGLLGIWGLLAAGLLGRVGSGIRRVLKLKRSAALLPWAPVPGRRAGIATSREVGVPMAVGWIRPLVLLPERLTKDLTATDLQQVVTHELGHLLRWDDWTNLAQQLLEAVFFFNPAVLWIGRRLDLEREIACDDRVVATTGATKAYALCLTRVRELIDGRGLTSVATGALNKKSFSWRIEMLLDGERNRSPRLSRVVLPGAVLILAAVALASFELARIVVAPPVLAAPLQTPAPSPRAQEEEKAKADQERARAVLRRQQEKLDQERAALEAEHKAAVAAFIGGQPVLSLEQKEPAVSEGELRSFLLSVAKNDSSPAVREAALSELGSLGGEEGARALASLYDESKDDGIKESILRYLAANGSKAAVEKLKAVAQSDPAEKRRVLAVRLLGSLGRPSTWFGLPPLPPEPPAPPAPPRRPPKP